jgi:uroporphyrinogen-III synthase
MDLEPLSGRTIAVPEGRELEIFAAMLERRGARVLRCPLVTIRDAPDPAPVLAFARTLAEGALDDLILTTGEGLRRILSCIEQHAPALREPFVTALRGLRRITRGPKPAKALRELGLKPDIAADPPTTPGIISALSELGLSARRIGVQLYGTEPNSKLTDFLAARGATVSCVWPYVYADDADEAAVRSLLAQLEAGRVDAMAFTSSPQVERLFAVGAPQEVSAALERTLVAAVGPVVAQSLARHGVAVALMPHESFFMKPLTSALEAALKRPSNPASSPSPSC